MMLGIYQNATIVLEEVGKINEKYGELSLTKVME